MEFRIGALESSSVRQKIARGVIQTLVGLGSVSCAWATHAQTDWIVNVSPDVPIELLVDRVESAVNASDVNASPLLQPGSWRISWTQDTTAPVPFSDDWQSVASFIRSIPGVAFASPNWVLTRSSASEPTDSAYALEQRSYMGQIGTYAMQFPQVWTQTRGSSDRVIAVLDSGVLFGHPDLQGKLLPGYDFVSDASPRTGSDPTDRSLRGSSDGDGRDADPSDPGDAPPLGLACDNGQLDSSFHGTSVSSVAAAQSDNGAFVTGVDWNARILPVRVSGRCGVALVSDLIDGMYWANQAGVNPPGVPDNPFKADVINLSFAAQESLVRSCAAASGQPMALAISDSVRAGVPVVVSAGNTGGELGFPASCPQAIAAAAMTPAGQIAGYSSRGMVNNALTLYVPGNANAQYAAANNSGRPSGQPDPNGHNAVLIQGTSFSAPILTGVVSLLKTVDPDLSFSELLQVLDSSSTPLPVSETCGPTLGDVLLGGALAGGGSGSCGSGALNPLQALNQIRSNSGLPLANPPQARVLPASVDALDLDGSLSSPASAGRDLMFAWTQTEGAAVQLGSQSEPVLRVLSGLTGNQAQFKLKVTDTQTNSSHEASVLVVSAASNAQEPLRPTATPESESASEPEPQRVQPSEGVQPAPSSAASSGGGGGGGALSFVGLLLLFGLIHCKRRGIWLA